MKTGRKETHGKWKSKEWNSWDHMKRRCCNPKDPKYKDYGGRGITLCGWWLKFENFYEDMGDAPSKQHSLDRIDNEGNYEPSNCRWATPEEQSNNRRKRNPTEKRSLSPKPKADGFVRNRSVNGKAKLSTGDIERIKELRQSKTILEVAQMFGVHISTISRAVRVATKAQ